MVLPPAIILKPSWPSQWKLTPLKSIQCWRSKIYLKVILGLWLWVCDNQPVPAEGQHQHLVGDEPPAQVGIYCRDSTLVLDGVFDYRVVDVPRLCDSHGLEFCLCQFQRGFCQSRPLWARLFSKPDKFIFYNVRHKEIKPA